MARKRKRARVLISQAPIVSKRGGERIGSYLWWTLREVEINRDRLKRLFDEHGLQHKYLPPPIVGHAAFRKAVAACKHGDRALMLRQITETPQEIIYGVVREDVDKEAEDLAYQLRCKIVYRKRTESVVIRDGNAAVAREVKNLFDDYKDTYIHTDIRRWVVRLVNEWMEAVTLKLNGGVYFIPHQHSGMLAQVNAIVTDLPGRSEFIVTPIFDSEETRTGVGKATRNALEQELATIHAEIAEFKEKPPRRDTLRRRLDDFGKLKGRAQMYANMLRFTAEDLIEGIGDLDKVVEGLIGTVEADVRKKAEERKQRRRKDYRPEARIVRKIDRKRYMKKTEEAQL